MAPATENPELSDCLDRIQRGEANAFRWIVRCHQAELLRRAYHFTGSWADAEDVTQTTLIKAFNALGQYDRSKPFLPWLFAIHRNDCRNFHYRKRFERLFTFRFHDVDPPGAIPSSAENFDRNERIQRCINQLSWKQKMAFVHQEIEGHTAESAAELMGCSPATVRVHLMRAKQNLRKMLRQWGINHE